MSVECSMLVFKNEYVALLQESKVSAGWHFGNLIFGKHCYRI